MFSRIPFDRVNWLISSFLIGTLASALTAVPAYVWVFSAPKRWAKLVETLTYSQGSGLAS